MISPEAGKVWFQVILFILLVSGPLLFILEPNTPAFVADALAFITGLVLLLLLWIGIRKSLK